ncbi:hypothetical protein QUW44_08885 [Limosilactobacillus pontis]|uniref:Polysaccharide pyruvyl transferase domain-containing protein n=1 Tax=Limosilactobacillus pontis TaxID=35787 RepID=A0ABT7UZV1_9LACO|nr:hypothetical protein [Limosilactobacillus pontis]MDM8267235.1 hypothetical protein [Limosilactobacillus pontis]
MKKRIGIMSMQRIYNYGSFLQAYSLKSIIKDLGYDVRFVDYHPGKTVISSDNKLKRKIIRAFETIRLKSPLSEKIKFIKYKADCKI